jgi:DNA-binding response OmpR family regulator
VNLLVFETEGLLSQQLRQAGHRITVASNSADVRRLARDAAFDVAVLGRIRPEPARLRVCRELRRREGAFLILLLVEDDEVEMRVAGLDAGADDCVSISCPFDELLARLRALSRRAAVQADIRRGES